MSTSQVTTESRPNVHTSDVIPEASQYVYRLLKEDLPDDIYFHTYLHTSDVVRAATRIGEGSGISQKELSLLTLAAWFHDVGFVRGASDHEQSSVEIASEFLSDKGLSRQDIHLVSELILSTNVTREPETELERILHDADIAHIGKEKRFFVYAERLRKESEVQRGKPYTELEWQEIQLDFLTRTKFKTEYARKRYARGLENNLKRTRQMVGNLLDARKPVPQIGAGAQAPGRGIETMFRSAYRNHINLSSIADSKANIMISVNAILMSIIVSFVSTRLDADPLLLVPSAILLVTSLTAIVFAIMSARPKVTSETLTLEDVRSKETNILFFGTFSNLDAEDFRVGLKSIMQDWDALYDSMIHDLYGLGRVLQKKYRLLWISFTVFMVGLVCTVAAFLVLFMTRSVVG